MRYLLEHQGGQKFDLNDLENPKIAKQIGSGGSGTVYRHVNPALHGQLIKLYHVGNKDYAAEHEHKVLAMMHAPPVGLTYTGNGAKISWPWAIVRDERGKFRGFAMQEVGNFSLFSLQQTNYRKQHGLPEAMLFRLLVARNLAQTIENLLRSGYYMPDLKPQNVRIYRGDQSISPGSIALIDIDGFTFKSSSGKLFKAGFVTEEYLYPKIVKLDRDLSNFLSEQVKWALAVIIFQLLNDNIHPFMGIDDPNYRNIYPPKLLDRVRFKESLYAYGSNSNKHVRPVAGSLHQCFDPILLKLFERTFLPSWNPPSPTDWIQVLKLLTNPGYACTYDKNHWCYGDFCGPCMLQQRKTSAKKNSQASSHTIQQSPVSHVLNKNVNPPKPRKNRPVAGTKSPEYIWIVATLIAGSFFYNFLALWPDDSFGLFTKISPALLKLIYIAATGAFIFGWIMPEIAINNRIYTAYLWEGKLKYFCLGSLCILMVSMNYSGAISDPFNLQAYWKSQNTLSLNNIPLNTDGQNLSTQEIKRIQKLLTDLGFDPGKIDGIYGPKTKYALRQYAAKRKP